MTKTTSLTLPDVSKLKGEAKGLIAAAREYVCTNDEELSKCNMFWEFITRKEREIQAELDKDLEPKIKLLHQMHKDGVALRKEIIGPWKQAAEIMKRTTSAYLTGKRQQQEEQNRRQAEEERQAALLLAELEGDTEGQAAIESLPAMPKQITPGEIANGAKTHTNWTFEIVDERKVPKEYWMIDLQKLTKLAKERKQDANVPGVRFFAQTSLRR